MSTLIKHTIPGLSDIVQVVQANIVFDAATTYFHADKQSVGSDPLTITSANGNGTLANLLALTKEIVAKVRLHSRSDSGLGYALAAHKAVDDTLGSTVTVASVVDLASAQTALNAVYTWYNTHRASTTYHYAADSTNAASSASATDQASSDTRANDLKTQINAHMAGGVCDAPILRSV